MDNPSPDLEKSNIKAEKLPLLPHESVGEPGKETIITLPIKQSKSIKSGPLPGPPPSLKEWKASGKRGQPPVAYEVVIKDAPNDALEYELFHGFKAQVSLWELEQRIQVLEKEQKTLNQRYTRAALYYLRSKLEEFVVGGEE